mmetsp:Transcript_147507/g.257921  ORF Transcript_147507/g.257921 Transcript_147507/m.257921 type:complete len:315 (-) Transcript_147507:116-1060(-)
MSQVTILVFHSHICLSTIQLSCLWFSVSNSNYSFSGFPCPRIVAETLCPQVWCKGAEISSQPVCDWNLRPLTQNMILRAGGIGVGVLLDIRKGIRTELSTRVNEKMTEVSECYRQTYSSLLHDAASSTVSSDNVLQADLAETPCKRATEIVPLHRNSNALPDLAELLSKKRPTFHGVPPLDHSLFTPEKARDQNESESPSTSEISSVFSLPPLAGNAHSPGISSPGIGYPFFEADFSEENQGPMWKDDESNDARAMSPVLTLAGLSMVTQRVISRPNRREPGSPRLSPSPLRNVNATCPSFFAADFTADTLLTF